MNSDSIIAVEDLSFRYPGQEQDTLRDLSFEVCPGEIFGFLGPNGAGKSTTQKILIGLLQGYRGQVQLLGTSLHKWNRSLFNKIGVSFEVPNLYGRLTALENLKLFASFYTVPTADPGSLLAALDLQEAADRRVESFSKGMKMRLNVCRALLPQPQLLFLDEPTSGLDPVNARRMKDFIRQKKETGTTVFLTTHNMEVATELCNRVAFLADGRIADIGAPHEFMLQAGSGKLQVEIETDGQLLRNDFPLESLGGNEQFFSFLQQGRVRRIHSHEATLEDVFLQVTGESL
ncbi:MAG: ABC transporter ATP-binding protein [bacterium]